MFDFAVLAIGRADEADRITAVPLNFEMKGQRFAFNVHQISRLASNNQVKPYNVWLQKKSKTGSDWVLMRPSRQIRKEDAVNAAAQRMIEDYLALTGHRSDVE